MIHIPGVYSGGETAGGHKWTQTKGEVELRVRLPDGTADGAVKCEIEPRALRLCLRWRCVRWLPVASRELLI